jgi:malonate-semialdehyde dehydrogenase (acetylating)/methylmalonate-semialdehyde dehydrogenase
MAISVAVAVGDATADALIERLRLRARHLKVGAPDAPGIEMGPLVTQAHLERVRDYIRIGAQEGARLVLDGRDLKVAGHESGYFLGPTLFDGVRAEMRIYKEEIFGPVLCVVRVPDLAAAVRLINAHEFANGTAIFTRSGESARDFTRAVEVGMVGVNVPIPVPMAFHSFGGWRNSLFGDHSIHGAEGVRFYTRLKTVTQRWPGTQAIAADFALPAKQ